MHLPMHVFPLAMCHPVFFLQPVFSNSYNNSTLLNSNIRVFPFYTICSYLGFAILSRAFRHLFSRYVSLFNLLTLVCVHKYNENFCRGERRAPLKTLLFDDVCKFLFLVLVNSDLFVYTKSKFINVTFINVILNF